MYNTFKAQGYFAAAYQQICLIMKRYVGISNPPSNKPSSARDTRKLQNDVN